MSLDDQARLYAQWRTLTHEEGRAIRNEEWERLGSLQSTKAQLQTAILETEQAGRSMTASEESLRRAWVSELVDLEKQNLELLTSRQKALQEERARVEQSRLNLRRLHQGFRGGTGSAWQCYS